MVVLLDTNIISYLSRDPHGDIARRAGKFGPGELITSVIVVGEIAFGFARRPSPRLERQVQEILRGMQIVDLNRATAAAYGSIRAHLERLGRPIGSNDLWIAAHALALDATLVTANEREFRRVPGLKVENWTA